MDFLDSYLTQLTGQPVGVVRPPSADLRPLVLTLQLEVSTVNASGVYKALILSGNDACPSAKRQIHHHTSQHTAE